MLGTLRRHSHSWIVKLILGALALSFVVGFGYLTGGAGYEGGGTDAAIVARVGGKPITNNDVAREHQRLQNMYREQLGDQLTDDLLEQLNLRFQAVRRLVMREVLLQEADRLGFRVSDAELAEAIASIQAFQNADGHFDPELYRYVLSQTRQRLTPASFEAQQREAIKLDKLERFVKGLVQVSDDEVLRHYLRERTTIDLHLLRFDPTDYRGRVRLSDDEIRRYYEQNAEQFRQDRRVQVQLVRFPLARWADEAEVPEAELREAYEQSDRRFAADEQVKARHILIKLGADATDEQVAAARAELNAIKANVNNDLDAFVESAINFSQDGSAPRGGDLGWFTRGRMVPQFEQAAFDAPIREVVGPIRTQFGLHLIYVEDRQTAGKRPFEDVRTELQRELGEYHALVRAREGANELVRRVGLGEDVVRVASELGAEIDTEWVDENSPRAEAKYPSEVRRRMFSSDGIPAGGAVIEIGDRPYYLRVLDREDAKPRPLAEVRSEIRNLLLDDRATTLAAEEALRALEALREGQGAQQVARRFGARLVDTGPFGIDSEELPVLGKHDEIRQAAFALSDDNPTPRGTFRAEGSYIVVRLKERVQPSPEDFALERDMERAKLLEDKRQAAWMEWQRGAQLRVPIDYRESPANLMGQS